MKMSKKHDAELTKLYGAYGSARNIEEFRAVCIETVRGGFAPNFELIEALKVVKTMNKLLQKTSDFLMKGQGNGVI